MASHGPLALGRRRAKAASESPQALASGIPGTAAISSFSAEKAARCGNCGFVSLGCAAFLGGFLLTCTTGRCCKGTYCCACAAPHCRGRMRAIALVSASASVARTKKRRANNFTSSMGTALRPKSSLCGAACRAPGPPRLLASPLVLVIMRRQRAIMSHARLEHFQVALKSAVVTAAVVPAILFAAPTDPAQGEPSFPSRPITMVVPLPAGGTADLLCRIAAEKGGSILNQQIVGGNRAGGAGGRVGTESVLRSPPDGYTLLCAPQLTYSVTHLVFAKAAFDTRGMVPISVLATYPLIVLARPGLPADNMPELIAYARAHPGPITE